VPTVTNGPRRRSREWDADKNPRRRAGPRRAQLLHWDEDDGEADDAADAVAEGSMPPRRYVPVHPDAALDEAERQVLVDALEAMDRARGGGGGG
jgi:Haem-binding domain